MTIERKVGMGIAGQPSGGATDVAEVFSTYLYTGTGSAQTITNGIDLAGEGGLVWSKNRGLTEDHCLTDTVRGAGNYLLSSADNAQQTDGNIASFNSSGYVFTGNGRGNYNNYNYASFTFRKKSGFFDCLTYTGNQSIRTISHGLDSPVGMLICKRTDTGGEWYVQHKDVAPNKELALQSTNGIPTGTTNSTFNNTAATSSVFTLGSGGGTNATGGTYVAYLFADNSSEDAENQMIKCGSFTGVGTGAVEVNLGWEPQFVILKNTSRDGTDWLMQDTMRGMSHTGYNRLRPNTNSAENVTTSNFVVPTSTGFTLNNNGSNNYGQSGDQMIYAAIRSEMMIEPEAATDVFHVEVANNNGAPDITTGFPVDMGIYTQRSRAGTDDTSVIDRIRGGFRRVVTNKTDVEGTLSSSQEFEFDHNNKVVNNHLTVSTSSVHWLWKRAKGYMDAVAYTGSGSGDLTLAHSLGVTPELLLLRPRTTGDSYSGNWHVWHKSFGHNQTNSALILNSNSALAYINPVWGFDSDTISPIIRGGGSGEHNKSTIPYIVHLFATLAGISKVGSYTGNGSNQTIDCGFSAGSRFILIKRTDATGHWYVWDSVRGIVSGNDPRLLLNNEEAEETTDDSVDPHNSGFIVNQLSVTALNVSSGTYIFYAIA